MSGKNINFDDKKIKKSSFYKSITLKTLMLIIYQFIKKNHTVQKIHLNALSDIMIKMLLDRYA